MKSISICGRPVKSYFVQPDEYLHLQKLTFDDNTPAISEDESLLILVKGGKGTIIINGVEFPLSEGSFAWLQSYHTFTIVPDALNPLSVDLLTFDYPLSSFLLGKTPSKKQVHKFMNLLPVRQLRGKYLNEVTELFKEFDDVDKIYSSGSSLIKVSVLGELALKFINIPDEGIETTESESEQPLGWNLILYINEHFSNPLTIPFLSKKFQTSGHLIEHELRNITGCDFFQILNRARINISTIALLSDDLSISFISEYCGFSSEVNFYRTFKKIKGCTPIDYQQKMLSNEKKDENYRGFVMNDSLMRLLNYIFSNSLENVSLNKLSKDLFLSESYLRELLTNTFGKSYKDIVDLKKVKHAEALLLTTDLPIIDIALNVGFNCTRSLSRSFKKIYGLSPNEYRKIHHRRTIT